MISRSPLLPPGTALCPGQDLDALGALDPDATADADADDCLTAVSSGSDSARRSWTVAVSDSRSVAP
jgi:hypothetical protein